MIKASGGADSILVAARRIALQVLRTGVMNVIGRKGRRKEEKKMTFTIDAENNITAFGGAAEAAEAQGEPFTSQQELAGLAASWPAGRLVEIWNSIPGLTQVKKFTDRKAAVTRIWKAIQSLNGDAAQPAAKARPKQPAKAKGGAKAKPAKATKKAAKTGARKRDASPREGSKKAQVIALLQRKGGATLKQIMDATDWQAHSVRGFISGALGKKMGLTVESTKREDGERVYNIAG